jgi:predicted permease
MFSGTFLNDIRIAVRSLTKSPAYTTIGLLTLALGIGLSTASFCTIDSLILRHLPYPQSDELLSLFRTSKQDLATMWHSPAAFLDLRAQTRSFEGISTWNFGSLDLVHNGAPAEQIGACCVSGNFFDLIRVQPERGRGFTANDEHSGAPLVAVITHRMWQQRFGTDPAILGKTLRLSRDSFEIVGVLPASFDVPAFWGSTEIFYPFQIHPSYPTLRDTRWLELLVRPKPGISRTAAQNELDVVAARFARDFPKEHAGDGLQLRDIRTAYLRTPSKVVTGMMIGLSALLLLATCINLAGLQLVRCLARKHELAVRSALGASRWREMSPLVFESLLLALGGGLLGLLVAHWANALLGRFILFDSTLPMQIPLDTRALGVAAAIAILSGLGFGLLPALFAARTRPIEVLNEGGRTATESRSDGRIRRLLIVAEIAIALLLVSTSAVFAVACASLTQRRLGWSTDHLHQSTVFLPFSPYVRDETGQDTSKVGHRFVADLQRDLAALPGVTRAAIASMSPLWGFFGQAGFVIDGRALPEPGREPTACSNDVSPGYFATIEAPLLRGRDFTPDDRADRPLVAIINQTLATALWPGQDPLGQRLRLAADREFAEIVGIVGDLDYGSQYERSATRFQIYFPLAQRTAGARPEFLLLRTRDAPSDYTDAVRRTVAALDPDLALTQAGSVRQRMRQGNRFFDTIAGNLVAFATVALLIAAIGIYGVIANLTAMRLHSIAIRVALGAAYGDIMRMILGHGLRLVGAGLLAGCALTYALVRVLAAQIPGMGLPGVWIIAVGMFLLAAVGLLACWLPAHRAARVDPLVALRDE